MAESDLFQADLDLAFSFARSEGGAYRDSAGAVQMAAPDVPRFDHDAGGVPRGLLIAAGMGLGGGDRLTIDPLILPADLFAPASLAVTIFHRFDGGSGDARFAYYSRNVVSTINALLMQAGHHLEIGVIRGFRSVADDIPGANFVRYRGGMWQLPAVLASGGALVTDGAGRPLISCGAEVGE